MRLETCIRKGLRLKAHRVPEVRDEGGRLVAEVEWIKGRELTCGHCSRRTRRVHSRPPPREWRDLAVPDRQLVLRYAPYRVRCPTCGPRVEHVPWAHTWQRITRALGRAVAVLARQLSWPYLKQWLWWASHSRLEPFRRFARLIREHLDGVLAWTRLWISNSALEGMNNKVKVISHRAYGFRTTETYIAAIWHGCGDLPLEPVT